MTMPLKLKFYDDPIVYSVELDYPTFLALWRTGTYAASEVELVYPISSDPNRESTPILFERG